MKPGMREAKRKLELVRSGQLDAESYKAWLKINTGGCKVRDEFNRDIEYIRISVTDRCNLRCVYCMPEDGIDLMPMGDLLSYEQILRLCSIFTSVGISKIKLTGGEPLVRKGLDHLIKEMKGIPGIKDVTMTTNGILVEETIESLKAAGLDAINISLDTLKEETFPEDKPA